LVLIGLASSVDLLTSFLSMSATHVEVNGPETEIEFKMEISEVK